MPYFLEGNCVRKGTKDDPGEVVKCHEEHAAAVAHLRALYVNVEDAAEKLFVEVEGKWFEFVKGGAGSGWHGPPEGTHDAEHAPNFAGGPGKDRTYGTEREEAPEGSKLCKCTKCGSNYTLPKGKQCQDVKCPGCGGTGKQVLARFDSSAEGESGKNPKPGRKKAQETHTCTCPECDKSVQVPLGQKCNEVKCPECKAMMKQGEDEKSVPCPACEEEEKASVSEPGATVHGEGGSVGEVASVMGDGGGKCKCPHCGKSLPCTAKACPYCKKMIDKVDRSEGDAEEEKRTMKSEGDGEHPSSHYLVVEDPGKPSTWHLRVKDSSGKLDHGLMGGAWAALHGGYRGNKYEGPNKAEALAKLTRLYKQEGLDTPGEKSFVSYKSDDGTWRWMTLSNWAVVDREAEVVSEQAYRDAIAHAQKSGNWGQLDLVHVDGTDVGDCDTLFIVKSGDEPAKFGGGGTWFDTAKATRARQAIQAEPEHWGVSIKFRFNPSRKVKGIYTGDIQVLKHSILPQQMAASYGTAIAVQGGKMSKQLDEKTLAALAALGHSQDEIEELAERQKALPQEDENVVEKEDVATQAEPERLTLWKALGNLLGVNSETATPDASTPDEARKADEVEEPATAAEPAEETKQAEGGDETTDSGALLAALGEAIAKSVGDMVRVELDQRDERIKALETQIAGLNESVEEKVEARLRDIPQAVKVAASEVQATAVEATPVKGLTFGRQPEEAEKFVSALMADIEQVVKDKTAGGKFQL